MLNRSHHHSSADLDSDSAPTTASRLAIPPRADASTSTSSARMPNSSGCVSIAAMRSELQRATELAAADDVACPLQQRQSTATRMMGRQHHHHLASPSSFYTSKDRVLGSWSGEDPARGDDDDDDGDEGDDIELKMQMRRLRFSAEGSGARRPADDEDDDDDCCYLVDSPELAAFLGMTTSAAAIAVQQQQQHFAPSLVKAASFSGRYQHANNSQQQQTRLPPLQQRGMMVPCSPPVPIPRKQLLRRRNSVTGSLLSTSRQNRGCDASLLVDASGVERTYSRTQCEARLWDEDWNFKLSLEARESFERSTSRSSLSANDENGGSNDCSPSSQQRPRRERGRSECGTTSSSRAGVWKPQSTSSLTSTADTTREDESGGSDFDADNDDGDCSDVFDMDDL